MSKSWLTIAGLATLFCCTALPLPSFAASDPALVAKGKYLTDIGGCASCHTGEGAVAFSGGLYMDTPYGPISTPNITPDVATGIGSWSDDQFYRAMHDGIGKRGEYLYPVMPFPWYTKLTRDDVLAIRAYLATLPPTHHDRPPIKLRFPFSVRESLLAWRTVFFKAGEFQPDPGASVDVNRGAYLVNGLAHCGECHNARPIAGQSKFRKAFQGGVIDDWYAPNITGDARDGIGSWSNADLATYLKTGVAPGKGVALGPMAETVQNLSHASDADLKAMAAYLKSTPPIAEPHQKLALFEGRDERGSEIYLNSCASCHGVDGKGVTSVIPGLQGNGAVTAQGPQNVIQVILGGVDARAHYAPMPAVGVAMTNEDIAAVTNFVRQTGQNSAPATAEPGMVAKIRESTDTLMNGSPTSECPAVSDPAIAKASQTDKLAAALTGMTDEQMLSVAQRITKQLQASAPHATQADLVNGVSATYCSVLRQDTSIDAATRAIKLGNFSVLVYMEANSKNLRRR